MTQHSQFGQRVQIHRGTYEGLHARILKFTSKQVYLRLSDGREVRIPQKSLEPPATPPPIPRELLPVPTLVTGQQVDISRGKYEGGRGTVMRLTPCKVYVFLEHENKEVRIDKKSVRVIRNPRTRGHSPRTAGATARTVSWNSDFSAPGPSLPQRTQIHRITPPRPSPASNVPPQRRSTVTKERPPRVVTPPPSERPQFVSLGGRPRSTVYVQQQQQQRGGGREPRVRNVVQAPWPSVHPSFEGRTSAPTPGDPSLDAFASLFWHGGFPASEVSSHTRRSSREHIIACLPVTTVEDPSDLAEHSHNCAICLEDFQRGDSLKKLHCQHGFHPNCLDPWIRNHPTCPTCRNPLLDHVSLH